MVSNLICEPIKMIDWLIEWQVADQSEGRIK